MNAPDTITPNSTMAELLAAFPAAQRTLFRKFHIGGCSSCAFDPAETVAALCARNGSLDPAAVLEHVRQSQKEDDRVQMGPAELKRLRDEGVPHRLLDIRTREEFEAVRIDGAIPFTQDAMTEILGRWPREELMIVCDHTGQKCMDAAAYFLGHGFTQVRALRGGIDAWAREIDPGMRRYRIE